MREVQALVVRQHTSDDHLSELIKIEDCVEFIVPVTAFQTPSIHTTRHKLQIQFFVDQTEAAFNDTFPVWPVGRRDI
ncbi:hypothetical protein D3C81_1822010 [compost metagenome]